jgi:tRNA nucleotidyltransferase (CCA-adding enzyme)
MTNKSNNKKIQIPGTCYLVGGALRDKLLGIEHISKDLDWVVIGATADEMLKAGFSSVGKEFPVFLHPITKEEYALARKERKVGSGHKGFICDFTPDITLEEDLIRRDLTINAMAQADSGEIIDPYNGLKDIKDKYLHHVSDAFIEDPLRVLRVCRFLARFSNLGFKIHSDTKSLMQKMVEERMLDELSSPRVWQEVARALSEDSVESFFISLQDVNALYVLFDPKLDLDKSLINNSKFDFKIIKNFKNKLNNLNLSYSPELIFCLFSHTCFINLKESSQNISFDNLFSNLPLPKSYQTILKFFYRSNLLYKNLLTLYEDNRASKTKDSKNHFAKALLDFLNKMDYWRKADLFSGLIGLFSLLHGDQVQDFLINLTKKLDKAWKSVDLKAVAASGVGGEAMEKYVMDKRLELIMDFI